VIVKDSVRHSSNTLIQTLQAHGLLLGPPCSFQSAQLN